MSYRPTGCHKRRMGLVSAARHSKQTQILFMLATCGHWPLGCICSLRPSSSLNAQESWPMSSSPTRRRVKSWRSWSSGSAPLRRALGAPLVVTGRGRQSRCMRGCMRRVPRGPTRGADALTIESPIRLMWPTVERFRFIPHHNFPANDPEGPLDCRTLTLSLAGRRSSGFSRRQPWPSAPSIPRPTPAPGGPLARDPGLEP